MVEQLERKLTWQEFRDMQFPDDDLFIYELIDGILVKKAAPAPPHQETLAELIFAFKTFLREHPLGRVFPAPIDVFFDEHNGVQPDLCFVLNERDFLIDPREGILGAPDLLIEIISPGSVRHDRVDKKNLYERFAVKEFWLIDPANKTVEIFTIESNAYQLNQFLETSGKARSAVLQGFEMEISTLFL